MMNFGHNVRLILLPFFNQLIDDEKSYGHFMQDNAMAHTEKYSVDALEKSSVTES
jgi:hypothetical protein